MKFLVIAIFIYGFFNTPGALNINQVNGGKSINQIADEIIKKYDQDKDGILDVAEDSFLREKIIIEDDSSIVIRTESSGLLFMDADEAGNKDGKVSKVELFGILENFDENSDGEINLDQNFIEALFYDSEWEKLDSKYEKRAKYELK
jgi:hypothetical protein